MNFACAFVLCLAGDVITQQFCDFLSVEARHDTFHSYRPTETRVDVFLHQTFQSKCYPELWEFCKKLLLLSLGQATVERGFSINKEVETCNMHEETMVSQRLICDYVTVCGGVLKVPITKELLSSAASARSRYMMYLDEEKQKKMNDIATQNQRAAAERIEELKKKKKCLSEVAKVLLDDADQLATQAEGKAGSLMAQLITKSNTLRKRHKEKLAELADVEEELKKAMP